MERVRMNGRQHVYFQHKNCKRSNTFLEQVRELYAVALTTWMRV